MNRGSIPGMSRRVLSSPKHPYRHWRPPAFHRVILQWVHKGCCWHSTTAHGWTGTWVAGRELLRLHSHSPCLQMSGLNVNTDICRGLLAVPVVNLCELLTVGHKKKCHITYQMRSPVIHVPLTASAILHKHLPHFHHSPVLNILIRENSL
jgi:hypothetical protein